MPYSVSVCQNRSCRRQGSAQVLQAFQQCLDPQVTITPSGCLGHCGSGPTVVVLPDATYYCHVQPQEVPGLIQRHLQSGQPIAAMLCRIP